MAENKGLPAEYRPSSQIADKARALLAKYPDLESRLQQLSRGISDEGENLLGLTSGGDTEHVAGNMLTAGRDLDEISVLIRDVAADRGISGSDRTENDRLLFLSGSNKRHSPARKCLSEMLEWYDDYVSYQAEQLKEDGGKSMPAGKRDEIINLIAESDEKVTMLFETAQVLDAMHKELWQQRAKGRGGHGAKGA